MSVSRSFALTEPLLTPASAPVPASLLLGQSLPKVILCDLDGTLIDSMPILADLATDVMNEVYGTPRVLARELYVATCGLPFVKQLEEIYPGDSRNARTSERFEAGKPALCNALKMNAGTREVLEALKSRGVKVVVSSNNGGENVDTFVRHDGFPFDLALGFGDGLAKGRPHLDRAAATFQAKRSEMLFVGDSLHDGALAEQEGVPFVGIAGTFSFERFRLRFPKSPIVRRFEDLLEVFA